MCKAIEKGMHIEGVRLLEKTGGKSGPWKAETTAAKAAPEPPPAPPAQPEAAPVLPEPPSPPTET